MQTLETIVLSFVLFAKNFGAKGAKDCAQLYHEESARQSGVYEVTLLNGTTTTVCCDMTTDGGGWTVFQRRDDALVDFYRDYSEYTNGFGEIGGSHWLGLEAIHQLSVQPQQLRVDMEGCSDDAAYAKYENFTIGNSASGYQLTIGSYDTVSSSGESLFYHHNGQKFATFDNDQTDSSCASRWKGGFWYGNCFHVNHNGNYPAGGDCNVAIGGGLTWHGWKGYYYSALKTKWMMRPMDFENTPRCLDKRKGKAGPMLFGLKKKGVRLKASGMWALCDGKKVQSESITRCALRCFQSSDCAGFVFKSAVKQCGFYTVAEVLENEQVADEGYDLYLKEN